MTQGQGETAVTTSALILTGLYGYRKATEAFKRAPATHGTGAPSRSGVSAYVLGPLGVGELEPVGQWATGMGVTFILLSIATSVNPTFGGGFAILVAVGAVLGNGQAVLKDLGHGLGGGFPGTPGGSSLEPLQPLQSGEMLPAHERLGVEKLLPGFASTQQLQAAGQLQAVQALSSNHPPVR